MPVQKQESVPPAPLPEDFLRLALKADSARRRAEYARAGLASAAEELEPDTQVLLLRQLYLAHLERHELRRASEVAQQMVNVGSMPEVAHHDAARVLYALGHVDEAISHQRMAARGAGPARRSFHFWCLANFMHLAGQSTASLHILRKAERWAARDLPLIRAHAAFIQLDDGKAPEGLSETIHELRTAKCREGYGQYLLGMIAHLMGDEGNARVHLRTFLRRNASADVPKTITLREEFRRARIALASIDSM